MAFDLAEASLFDPENVDVLHNLPFCSNMPDVTKNRN